MVVVVASVEKQEEGGRAGGGGAHNTAFFRLVTSQQVWLYCGAVLVQRMVESEVSVTANLQCGHNNLRHWLAGRGSRTTGK